MSIKIINADKMFSTRTEYYNVKLKVGDHDVKENCSTSLWNFLMLMYKREVLPVGIEIVLLTVKCVGFLVITSTSMRHIFVN